MPRGNAVKVHTNEIQMEEIPDTIEDISPPTSTVSLNRWSNALKMILRTPVVMGEAIIYADLCSFLLLNSLNQLPDSVNPYNFVFASSEVNDEKEIAEMYFYLRFIMLLLILCDRKHMLTPVTALEEKISGQLQKVMSKLPEFYQKYPTIACMFFLSAGLNLETLESFTKSSAENNYGLSYYKDKISQTAYGLRNSVSHSYSRFKYYLFGESSFSHKNEEAPLMEIPSEEGRPVNTYNFFH